MDTSNNCNYFNEKEFQHVNLVCKLNNKCSSGNLQSIDAFVLVDCVLGAYTLFVFQYTQVSVKHETIKKVKFAK